MLADAQKRLEQHFSALKAERADGEYPIYAFEHGLQLDEIAEIGGNLKERLKERRYPESAYWLLWTIVAAEIGYTYDGDEYWQSFVTEVPGWKWWGDRKLIRKWFSTFTTNYGGFSPRGRWADQFSIIAWPIAHSILPRYLQSLFAAHLHEIRYDLAQQGYLGVTQLGEFIRRSYYGGSSRFGDFLQQTELTAHLVLALRDEDIQGEVSPIHRPTLRRIIADLEIRQSSREHLREARKVLREGRVQVGYFRGGRHNESSRITATVGLRITTPKLLARLTSASSWQLGVSLPDFTRILQSHGVERADLDQVRMRFTGEDGWMPGRALLSYSNRQRPIAAFLKENSSLVEFDLPRNKLVAIVDPHLRLQGDFPFLLRIQGDGIAHQVLGNNVRADEEYVLLVKERISSEIERSLTLLQKECVTSGVVLYYFHTPQFLTEVYVQALKKLHLGYGLRVRIDPVGLVPRSNGDGGSMWLPDEEVVLRLSADFDVARYYLSVDDQQRVQIPVSGTNEVIISVGSLPTGAHTVQVTAESLIAVRGIEPEIIFIHVRAPEPWRESVRRQAGFRLQLEPADANLEDLFDGRAEVSISGPDERHAAIDLLVFNANGHVSETCPLGRVRLPANADTCRKTLAKLEREPLSEKLQAAPRFDVAVSVEELGYDRLSFQHETQPLRWKIEHEKGALVGRLVDEAGADEEIRVWRYDVGVPHHKVAIETQSCIKGFSVPPPGSLFTANYRGRQYAAVISLREKLTRFSDLGAVVKLGHRYRTAVHRVTWLLLQYRRWMLARPLGPLAITHKSKVLGTIGQRIAQVICHGDWADRLELVRHGQSELLDQLQRDVGGSPGFAVAVWDLACGVAEIRELERVFSEKSKVYRISSDLSLCSFAFQIAFDLNNVCLNSSGRRRRHLQAVTSNVPLLRGAQLAKVAYDISSLERRLSKSASAP